MNKIWKLLKRKSVFTSPFASVYEDTVELPNGTVIEDYTVIEKPSYIMIVATDRQNNLIGIKEYKHGAGKIIKTLPAGHIEKDEDPLKAAERELLEEVGGSAESISLLGQTYDYPSKDIHKAFVARAINVTINEKQKLDNTEDITVELVPIPELKKQIIKNQWPLNSSLAAITLSGILF